MGKYIFTKVKDESNAYDVSNVTVEVETENLVVLLEEFRLFLLASGYAADGDIILERPENDYI